MNRLDLGQLRDVDGYQLRVAISDSGYRTDDVTLVMVNGMGCSLDYWDPVVERLADVQCIRYDRPGLGGSSPSRVADDSIEREVDLLISVCDGATSPETPIVLVGHSYGGMIAETAMRLHPSRFAGLVLVDGTDPVDHVDDDTRVESLVALAVSFAVAVPGVAKLLGTSVERAATYTTTISATGPRLSAQQRSLIGSPNHIRATLAEDLRIPGQCREAIDISSTRPFPNVPVTLLVASDQRTLTRTRRANEWIRQNEARVTSFGTHASVQVLRSAHLMMFDVPDAVASAIRKLMTEVKQ